MAKPISLEALRAAFEKRGVKLPIITNGQEAGEVIDMTGRDVFVVDHNRTRPDHQAREIATLIAMAVNAAAGVEHGEEQIDG